MSRMLSEISALYKGRIRLFPPCGAERPPEIPKALYDLLRISDGIAETTPDPAGGGDLTISWVLYPLAQMLEETAFYREEYGLEGAVFATDGCGNPFLMKPGGSIVCYDAIDGTETAAAPSLADFFCRK